MHPNAAAEAGPRVMGYHAGSKPSPYVIERRYLRWRWLADIIAEQQRAGGSDIWQGNYYLLSTEWLEANGYAHLLSAKLEGMTNSYWRERLMRQGRNDAKWLIEQGYLVRLRGATKLCKTGKTEHQAVWQLGKRWYERPTEAIDGHKIGETILPYEQSAAKYVEAMLWLERLWLWMRDRATYDKTRRRHVWRGYIYQLPSTRLEHSSRSRSNGSVGRRLWTLDGMGCIRYEPTRHTGNKSKPSVIVLLQRPSEYIAGVRDRDIDLYAEMWQDDGYRDLHRSRLRVRGEKLEVSNNGR